jgi:hypothetical protein
MMQYKRSSSKQSSVEDEYTEFSTLEVGMSFIFPALTAV